MSFGRRNYRVPGQKGGNAFLIGLGLFFLLVPFLASCAGPAPLQMTPIDLGLPPAALKSPVVGPLPDNTPLHVRITFKVSQSIINKLQGQKGHPGQPSHLENLAKQIGIDDGTYQKIKDFFNLQGIALNLSKLRTNLAINAKASTFAKLLQTHFVIHKYNGRTFYAPATPPKLPKFIVDSMVAITGLDNYSARPQHTYTMQNFNTPHSSNRPKQDCNPLDQTLLPKDVAHAYGYDQLWARGWHGENMTVNLVEVDGFYGDDIQNYFDCLHFQGNLKVVNVNSPPKTVELESTLDIETIAGLAPTINIVDYQGPNTFTGFNDEFQQILNDNTRNTTSGSVVSISWGAAENQMTSSDIMALDQSIELLTKAEHMTIFADTYDCAAFADQTYNHLSVSFPASDPLATAVGGTVLNVDGAGNRTNEVAWSDGSNHRVCNNQWGTGGGLSTIFKRPSWQDGQVIQNKYANGTRQLPEISAIAFNQALYYQGQWLYAYGTSEATPTWATAMALVNENLIKQVHEFFYSPQLFYMVANNSAGLHLEPFYDVTRGNNLYYPATPGWDFATGLGTPNLVDFSTVLLWSTIHH